MLTSCRLLLDQPADGAWNMAVDELLLDQAARRRQAALRFYAWRVATVSLGYFQPYESRAGHAASRHCPLVRRISGGGAIIHDQELTYGLALPAAHASTARAQDLYRLVHGTLVEALGRLGVRAEMCTANDAPAARDEPFLCFQRRAWGDVLVDGEKIAGSAQRRRRGAILQHGSVLLRTSSAAPEAPGLESITRLTVSLGELTDLWGERLATRLDITLRPNPLSAAELDEVQRLRGEKYASEAWSRRK